MDNIKIEVLGKSDSAKYLGQKITFEEQETEEVKNRLKSSVGSVPQISSRIDIERLPPLPQTSHFQHGSNTDDDLRQWNVDINTKARKDD